MSYSDFVHTGCRVLLLGSAAAQDELVRRGAYPVDRALGRDHVVSALHRVVDRGEVSIAALLRDIGITAFDNSITRDDTGLTPVEIVKTTRVSVPADTQR